MEDAKSKRGYIQGLNPGLELPFKLAQIYKLVSCIVM
jgi:hypothetical protein